MPACRRLLTRAQVQGLLVLLSSCRLFPFVELTKTDVYLVSDLSKGHCLLVYCSLGCDYISLHRRLLVYTNDAGVLYE